MSKCLTRQSEVRSDVGKALENNSRWYQDCCRSWFVCAASLMSVIVVSGIAFSYGLLLPSLMDAFEATRQETAWIGTLYVGFAFLVAPLSSYINDRFSYRFTAILGSLSGIIGFIFASWSSHLWMMYLTFGLMSGIGHGLIFSTCNLVILQHFVKWRSVVVGIVASGPAIGMFVVSQITDVFLSTFGWPGTMRGYAILFFFCGLCATVFIPREQFEEDNSEFKSQKLGIKHEESATSSLFRNSNFLILLTSFAVVNMSFFVPSIHIAKYCVQELHMSEKHVSMLYTYMAVASFISRHIFCKLGDFPYVNRFYLYQVGMTISGLCILCIPVARSFVSILMPLIGFRLMDGAMAGQQSLLVLECVGHQKVNRAWGYIMLFAGISATIGPPLIGLMADELGSYTIPFFTAGAVLIAGASITQLMTCVKQKSGESDGRIVRSAVEELLIMEKVTVL